MDKTTLLLVCLLLPAISAGQSGWELKRDREGIVIYTKESPGSPLKEYRASGLIQGSMEDVYDFLTDLEYRPQWIGSCVGIEIIDTTPDGRIRYHTAYDVPWPLADRDLVAEAIFGISKADGSAHLLTRETELQYESKPGVIRMPSYREEVFLEARGPGSTMYRCEGFTDPGGSVPAWVTNVFLVDNIYDSLVKTRECVVQRSGKKAPEGN